ncbi:MAG: alpha/beta fold hydrolase [Pseudomonadota bacterium]|jgi:predicted alpha/beta hydrolase
MHDKVNPNAVHNGAPIEIIGDDGVRLAGHFFARAVAEEPGSQPDSVPRLPVLMAGATGVPQQFYRGFAAWLAAQGHDVLTFDYRGMGLSLQGPLKQCRAELLDWGRLDIPAALDALLAHTGATQAVLLGHSAGAQMLGVMPNHQKVARLVGVAASTGWFNTMRPSFRVKAIFGLRVFVPLAARLLGYAPTAALGLGQNLPAQVGIDWGRWCAAGGFARYGVRAQPQWDRHAEVRTPVTVFHASDDDIANPDSVADLIAGWPNASSSVRQCHPHEFGLQSIGHLDWFRRSHQALWPALLQAVQAEQEV